MADPIVFVCVDTYAGPGAVAVFAVDDPSPDVRSMELLVTYAADDSPVTVGQTLTMETA